MDKENKQVDLPAKMHKKQLWTRIYLPLGLTVLVVFGIGLLISLRSVSDASVSQTWASMGLVFLLIPPILFSVVILVVLILAVFGMTKANKSIPPHLQVFRTRVLDVNEKSRDFTNKLAIPVIKTRSVSAAIKNLFNKLRSKTGSNGGLNGTE